jgi:serine protease DegS
VLDRQKIDWIFNYIGKPVLTGLFLAALLMLMFPQFRGDSTDFNNLAQKDDTASSDWLGPVSYAAAVRRAAPSVVNIYTRKLRREKTHPLLNDPFIRRFFNYQQQRLQSSLGSGIIVRDDGFIMTNNHVVANVDEIVVLLYDGRDVPAKIVGTDPDTDLAILKIDVDQLQPISIGDAMDAKIGDVVLAIGNPYGLGQAVTQGIISATGRNGLGLNTFENFIQTDADINPGNSGGALVDVYGNLLGINTAKLDRSGAAGMSFAIPVNEAQKVLNDIIQYGRVIRGWLGMDATPLNQDLARHFNTSTTRGLLVNGVFNTGPAQKAGIRPGDIVIGINGTAVTDRHSSASQIADVMPGQPIKLEILRGIETFTLTAIAGTRPVIAQ